MMATTGIEGGVISATFNAPLVAPIEDNRGRTRTIASSFYPRLSEAHPFLLPVTPLNCSTDP